MNETFVFDASALIAFLNDEAGANKVENILQKARKNDTVIYMNKLNILEIYYGVYREDGKDKAEETLVKISNLPVMVIDTLNDNVFKEAGRLKATHKISLADSVALAEAMTKDAQILTADHHEFDSLAEKEDIRFYWIR